MQIKLVGTTEEEHCSPAGRQAQVSCERDLKAGFDNGHIGQYTATPLDDSIWTTADDLAPFREGTTLQVLSRSLQKQVPAFQEDIPD